MKRNVSLIITSRGWSENQWAMAVVSARWAVISGRCHCSESQLRSLPQPRICERRPGMTDQRCAFCISCA
jgi:hypothetical protein